MKRARRPDFSGRTVAVLASGPSLTAEDIEAVRRAGWVAITTNTTFRDALWADAVFGFDDRFWKQYADEIKRDFLGRRITVAQHVQADIELESTYMCEWFESGGNSGACALAYAIAGRPDRIVLLGCDCMFDGDKKHHHGDHPQGMTNCLSITRWPADFKKVSAHATMARIPVINASRRTRLDCFPRATLEQLLETATP